MPKICLVGAGSTVFSQNILGDVLSSQRVGDYVISLFDIDPEQRSLRSSVALD
ncbi:alpha-glucosidase/alpha-galactosidase, partial [Rhizobium leguminosarum]|uniref:family 4 glycosyl hydrolase n=1 Tax=Rhizobium leguminosarum TaxID=384 RepID=UPI003F9C2BBC